MPTNKELEDEVSNMGTWITVTLILLGIFAIFFAVHTIAGDNSSKVEYLESVTDTQRDDIMSLSWEVDAVRNSFNDYVAQQKSTINYIDTSLDNIELSKYAKIYDLDITICKMDTEADEIKKRHVTMKNVVGINPSVERTATTVDTWLWYGSSVEIPTIMDDEDEYACGLEVISVK